jgi:enamine deaminase RidA (YjgF/YER057c/UK114 family)
MALICRDPRPGLIPPDPACVTDPLRSAVDGRGRDRHDHLGHRLRARLWLAARSIPSTRRAARAPAGMSAEPDLYFLGLPWQSRRGSAFIWGVWHDARSSPTTSPSNAPIWPMPRPLTSRLKPPPHPQIMAHTRIRKFNTRDTYPEQKLDNDLCQAVVARGTMIFLRGQCPQDLDTAQNIGSHDPVEQTHKVMQNIRQLIEECGGKMEHLCKVVVYLTDVRHREAVYRTMGEYIRGVHPVSTGVVVTALARPDWLVEIDATAMIPD